MNRHVRQMFTHRDRVQLVIELLTDAHLALIEQRSRFQATVGREPGIHGSDVSRPTEAEAVQNIEGRLLPDPQAVAIRIISDELRLMASSSNRIVNAFSTIQNMKPQTKRTSSLATCNACLRDDVTNVGNDRIRAGYCLACYTAWNRTGGDRHAFELTRRGNATTA